MKLSSSLVRTSGIPEPVILMNSMPMPGLKAGLTGISLLLTQATTPRASMGLRIRKGKGEEQFSPWRRGGRCHVDAADAEVFTHSGMSGTGAGQSHIDPARQTHAAALDGGDKSLDGIQKELANKGF